MESSVIAWKKNNSNLNVHSHNMSDVKSECDTRVGMMSYEIQKRLMCIRQTLLKRYVLLFLAKCFTRKLQSDIFVYHYNIFVHSMKTKWFLLFLR